MAGILAKKVEMTRVVKDRKFIPVTLLEIPVLKVVAIKTLEKDGYNAITIGMMKTEDSQLKEGKNSLNHKDFSQLKEFPLSEDNKNTFTVGQEIDFDIFDGVELVTITGTSKGKGFTGAMKKHNFSGGPASHGSKFHRALGSIGNRKPTRTHKGKKMHGHHGDVTVSLRKVPLELVNKELRIIGVRGGVPGARNSLVHISF